MKDQALLHCHAHPLPAFMSLGFTLSQTEKQRIQSIRFVAASPNIALSSSPTFICTKKSNQTMPKLGEFLHQQQEPFALDTYLLERGYPIARRKSSLNCTELAKAVFGRLVSHYSRSSEKGKIKNPNESCDGNLFSGEMVDEDEDEELKRRESCSTSIPQCRLKKPTRIHAREFPEHVKTSSCDQYIINKKLLLETKQLLIDCVREVIEQQRTRDDDGSGLKKILGSEELWKLVCENVWHWSMDSIHEANTVQELILHPELQKEEISIEIGDAILEGIIWETFC